MDPKENTSLNNSSGDSFAIKELKSEENPKPEADPESENGSDIISGIIKVTDQVAEEKSENITQKNDEKKEIKKDSGSGKKKKKKTAGYYALSFLIKIGVTALIVWALLTWVVGLYVNHSNSSYPMLKDGDLCLTYKLGTVVRGDEVAYLCEGQIRFGRIVGTAGDVVDVNEGSITINGYGVFEDAVYPTTAEGAKIAFPYTVPQDTVFVLNDYRDDPTDSRVYGGIPLESLRGKVIMVLRRRGI